MKKPVIRALLAALALSFAGSASAVVVTASNDATALASAMVGSGINIMNPSLIAAGPSAAATFTNGGNIGFNNGVLLTTGQASCAVGPNNQAGCSGPGTTTSLKFDFTSTTGNVFFNYVFASEEYNEFVGTQFNDLFEMRLNGVNIALLPGGGGVVSINNVNNNFNAAYYRDNKQVGGAGIDTQYDGLTTVLSAQATGLIGINTFEFLIMDQGDSSLDSGVFIEAGTFSADPVDVPEPGSLALLGLGILGLAAVRRKKSA
jgi:hypothetical protein